MTASIQPHSSRQIQAEKDLEEQAELRRQHIVILDRAIEADRMVRDDPKEAREFRQKYVR